MPDGLHNPRARNRSFPQRALRSAGVLALACSLWSCAEPQRVVGDPSDGLVFIRVVDGSNEVARARLSDGAIRVITRTPERSESWPYWSQSAGLLLFQVTDPTSRGSRATTDLALWDPRTGSEAPLTSTPNRDERWPDWSPDGRRLVFAFRGGPPPRGAGISWVEFPSRAETPIATTTPSRAFFRPHFDATGERMLAQRRGPDGKGSHLWIFENTAPPQPLTADPAWFDTKAWFTRDGSRVLYSRKPAAGGPHEIVSIAPDGSDLRRHASDPRSDDHSARPSPTRDEFAFVSNRAGSFDVFVADFDRGRIRQLTQTPHVNEYAPRWSPDGERLAVITSDTAEAAPRLSDPASLASARIRVLDRDGRVLFDAPGLNVDWMPPWP